LTSATGVLLAHRGLRPHLALDHRLQHPATACVGTRERVVTGHGPSTSARYDSIVAGAQFRAAAADCFDQQIQQLAIQSDVDRTRRSWGISGAPLGPRCGACLIGQCVIVSAVVERVSSWPWRRVHRRSVVAHRCRVGRDAS
jgi:hypothetical protein